MRAAVGCVLWFAVGCVQSPATSVEQNTKEVVVTPEAAPYFPELKPAEFAHPTAHAAIEPRDVARTLVSASSSVSTFPPDVTAAGDLREVHVQLDVLGTPPAEASVQFMSPSGQLFDRQSTRLTGTVHDKQSAQFTLPVMGTLIDSSAIVGTWRAHLFIDDAEVSAVSFEVTP
jgi:hypothetical protein